MSNRIVCAIEPNSEAKELAQVAAHLAHRDGAELTLIHVIPPVWHPYAELDISAFAEAKAGLEAQILEEARENISTLAASIGVPPDHVMLKTGDPVGEIVECAEELKASMIVMGVHNRRGLRRLLGSTAHGVLNGTDKSILLVHTKDRGSYDYENIIVAVDTSDTMTQVMTTAKPYAEGATTSNILSVVQSLATTLGGLSPGVFTASWPIADFHADLMKAVRIAVKDGCEKVGLTGCDVAVIEGDPAHEICLAAKTQEMDLIVIGSGTRHVIDRILLGSTAHAVLNNTPCDVLVAR